MHVGAEYDALGFALRIMLLREALAMTNYSLSSLDQVGVVAGLPNLLILVIPDLIRDPLLWGRNVEESR